MKTKKCEICNKEFEPKSWNSKYCSKTHKKTCKYCNEEFDCASEKYDIKDYCNKKECINKAKLESAQNTLKEKYGTRHCKNCGDEFIPKAANQIYCKKPIVKQCVICGKDFNTFCDTTDVKTCSKKCNAILGNQNYFNEHGKHKGIGDKEIFEKGQKTLMDRYGTTNIQEIDGVREKTEKTNMNKYGAKNVLSKGTEIRDKIDKDNINKYKSITPFGNKETQDKIKKDNIEKFGVEYPLQNKEIWNKAKETIIENNGGMGYASETIKEKAYKTQEELYGVKHNSQVNIKNMEIWQNINQFILNNKNKYTAKEISNMTGISYDYIRMTVNDLNLQNYVKDFKTMSKYENDFELLLKDLGFSDNDYIKNYRKLISPKEIDFYIPKLNLAIEISPTETHCSNQNKIMGNKPQHYHYDKFIECEKKGIRLITIFDWINIEDVIQILKNNDYQFNDDLIKTDNALGYTKQIMNNQGYELLKEDMPMIRYKELKKECNVIQQNENDLQIYDCGHRIWRKMND